MKRQLGWLDKKLYSQIILVALVSILLAGVTVGTASAAQSYVPNEFIIHAQSGTSQNAIKQAVGRMGAHIVTSLPVAGTYLIRMGLNGKDRAGYHSLIAPVSQAASAWAIDRIQPNLIYKALATPNDELWAKQQWDMEMINMPAAWEIQKGSTSVIVAVNDSGVAAHPDLVDRLLPGYDFIDNDADASPEPGDDLAASEGESHGTHVAGTIAAQGNNQIGVCGVCWDGVKILPVRILGPDGGTSSGIVQGLDFAMKQGAKVINMSYGAVASGQPDESQHAKMLELAKKGIILVAAAGNSGASGDPRISAPAMYDETIAVASLSPNEAIAPYSSYGPGNIVDIAAPGGDANYGADGCIWSTIVKWDDKGVMSYDYAGNPWQGTSMACPHVAGAAALLLSAGVAPGEVRSRLVGTARPPKTGTLDKVKYGAGILDVQAAIASADLRIIKPVKSSTVGSNPDFKISLRGVDPASIKVYMDYADEDENGIPDNLNEPAIIDSGNINYYLTTSLAFSWPLTNPLPFKSNAPLSQGTHFIYATATASIGGARVSDWAAFTVAGKIITAGIHLFAFPYSLNTALDPPSNLLLDKTTGSPVDFTAGSSLSRYVTKTYNASTGRLYSKYAVYPADRMAWSDTVDAMPDPYNPEDVISWFTGGGYPIGAIGNATFPAGSGFWLVLSRDAVINDSYQVVDAPNGYNVYLYQGWNMIGNPYSHAVPWRGALLSYRGEVKNLINAETAGWVKSALYGYKSGAHAGYERISDKALLEPYNGYWLMALVGGTDPYNALVLTILP